MTAAIVLMLILNGAKVDLPHPITATMDAQGTQQIAVPVREVFEAAGFVVQYHADGRRYVEITGYVDRLPKRHLVRHGILYIDRPELQVDEYVADLPFTARKIDGTLYAPAISLRIIGGGDVLADLDARTLHWTVYEPDAPPLLEVEEVISDLPRWLHRRVQVQGAFIGAAGDPAHWATALGAPAPGAWAVADETGAIYCTDAPATNGALYVRHPTVAFAQQVTVAGIVRPGWGGVPYLSAAEIITETE